MIELSSHDAFLAALDIAHDVACEAYVLPPSLEHALEAAAARGAHVRVRVEGAPLGTTDSTLARLNARSVADLRSHGVDAVLHVTGDRLVHSKLALVDGVAWLDDRNFPGRGPDLIVRDDEPADVAALAGALAGTAAPPGRVAFDKSAALALEADVLSRGAPLTLDVSTESFSYGQIERMLHEAVARGARVRLIVCAREIRAAGAHELGALQRLAGAEIRVRDDVDKLAVVPGRAWLGSANATQPDRGQTDWGLTTTQSAAVAEIETRFEAAWQDARPYVVARQPAT